MKKFAILLDSTCDMSKDLLERFDIDYVKMGVTFNDNTYPASLTWDDFTPEEFYNIMKSGVRVFTNQINEPEFTEVFNKILADGKDILYIACSSGLSGSVKAAQLAAEKLNAEEKGKVIAIDSLISGMGQGLLGILASELRAAGKTIDEVAATIEVEKMKYNQWGTVADLNYLKRAGRVTASSAFFGNLFGVKPIIISDTKGKNFAYKKVKGRKSSIDELIESVIRTSVDSENHIVAITHADAEEDALKVKEGLIARGYKCKEFIISNLGPILGASCGPQTLIAYNYGTEVTICGE